jgi:predicted DNA-binding transcriptional regulator AlpA
MIKLLSPKAVCAVTSISRSTLDRLVAEGRFPRPHRITAHRLGYRADEVAEWLEALVARREVA